MPETFLVVIDTTGRVEAKNFTPGIQNFYFIHAQDEEQAKAIVLHTFRSRPSLLAQLQYAVKATRLSAITRSIGPGSNFWTYVPFGNQRQPGQQGIMPNPDKLLRPDQYGQASAQTYIPPAPVGGEQVTPEDLRGVQFSGADASVLNKLRNPNGTPVAAIPEEAAPLNPEQETIAKLLAQNQAMMEKMSAMMAAQSQPQATPTRRSRAKAPATPNVPTGPAAPPAE